MGLSDFRDYGLCLLKKNKLLKLKLNKIKPSELEADLLGPGSIASGQQHDPGHIFWVSLSFSRK